MEIKLWLDKMKICSLYFSGNIFFELLAGLIFVFI